MTGPWLNAMRNSLNSQVWAFKQPNFLCVSATHGPAQLALYDQETWDKYQLAKLAGGNVARNTFIVAPPASAHDPLDFQSLKAYFRPRTTASWSSNGAASCSWPAIMRFGNMRSDFPLSVRILTIFR